MDALRPRLRLWIRHWFVAPWAAERPKVRYDAEHRNQALGLLAKLLSLDAPLRYVIVLGVALAERIARSQLRERKARIARV